jgi:hypothetical protein
MGMTSEKPRVKATLQKRPIPTENRHSTNGPLALQLLDKNS